MFSTEIDKVTEPEWNVLLDQFSDASIYQTWAYGAVSWGEQQLSHAVFRKGQEVIGLAQLRLVRVPLIARGVAYLRWGPACTPAGTSWDETTFRAVVQAIVSEYVEHRHLLLRIVPRCFTDDSEAVRAQEILGELGFHRDEDARPYHTFLLDLAPPLDQIRKQFDQKWRNQLNGAERNNLEILEGSGDDLYQQFLALYHEMMVRKQFDTTVNINEFRRIQQRLPESQKMWTLVARKDRHPMTALVGSRVGDMGIYLLGATSNDGMKTKGSYLQQWRFIQHLKQRGCRWYDLGGINPDTNPGVYHFKQGLGGKEVTGLGRLSLGGDLLSTASVAGAECLRSLVAKIRNPRSVVHGR